MSSLIHYICFLLLLLSCSSFSQDVITCNGFVKSDHLIDYSRVDIQLVSSSGVVKETSDCSPTNGYFLIPVYDKGDYIVRVVPPTGWSFSPSEIRLSVDGSTDQCSRGEDIVFNFIGFLISGQVVTVGQTEGPSGVTVSLVSTNTSSSTGTNPILTETIDGGKFFIEGVPPGQYVITGSHSLWNISKNQVSIEVLSDTITIPAGSVTVQGFDVRGSIESNGEPVPGVQFQLYPQSQSTKSACGESVGGSGGSCVAVSDDNGVFTYPSLSPGDYILEPHYKSANSTFQVFPESVHFSIQNDSVVVKPKFEVQGFTIFGRVLSHRKGSGLEGVKVIVGGQLETVTDKDGYYKFQNVSTGTYNVKVEGSLVEFDAVSVEVTPSSPVLPDIIPSRYSVCGHVTITRHHTSLKFNTKSRNLVLVSESGDNGGRVSLDSNGDFCYMLSPGEYSISVFVSEEEAQKGLSILPRVLPVTVETSPISGLEFKQYIPSLTGKMSCLKLCRRVNLLIEELGAVEGGKNTMTTKVSVTGNTGLFNVKELLPGKYKISLEDSLNWCWEKEELIVSLPLVPLEEPPVIRFTQTGYLLTMTMSHESHVNIYEDKEIMMKMSAKKGLNNFCIDRDGQFSIVPDSCHEFDADMYVYLTDIPLPLVLTAVSHVINVYVYVPNDKPLEMNVTFSNGSSILNGPNTFKNKDNRTVYHFIFSGSPGESIIIFPQSPPNAKLICNPKKQNYTVSQDCPESVPPFHCDEGFFVTGRMDPPLVGVSVTVTTGNKEHKVTTDEDGQYRVGPFPDSIQYTIVPYLDEYVFEAFEDDPHSFKAMKKSKLIIKIIDGASQNPLVGVLISLSGEGMRNSSTTSVEGSVEYNDIFPGQYYIKPLLREFEFQPPSMVVDLKQGEDLTVAFKAVRVAFSCSGKVSSLNGSPLESVTIKLFSQGAAGDGSCKDYHDTSLTDGQGIYKFRGLQPQCQYQLSVVIDEESIIDKGLPLTRHFTLSEKDIEGQDFIAVLKTNRVYVTGNVIIANLELLGYITVRLFSDKYLESQVFSVGTDPIGFFHMPPVPRNQSKMYFVQLDTALLVSQSYRVAVSNSNISVTANRDTHVTFNVTAKSVPLANGNNFRGSLVGIFVALLVVFLLANIDKVLAYSRGGRGGVGGGFRGKRHS